MESVLQYLVRHGYPLLFLFVALEQMGAPVPATPALVAMGALVARGSYPFWGAALVATIASLMADAIWFQLGRAKGHPILKFLCKISFEPDSCVSNTRSMFKHWGAAVLLVAKFVPGLSTVAPPLAGITRMSIGRFAIFDFAGSLIWVSTFMGLGYLFHRQLERVADWASRFGTGMIVVIAGAFAGWALFKRWQRERFIRKLAVARVDPEDALHAIERGDLFVIDLRSADEYETAETKIPGAIWLNRRFLEEQAVEIPRDRDVLLYCT